MVQLGRDAMPAGFVTLLPEHRLNSVTYSPSTVECLAKKYPDSEVLTMKCHSVSDGFAQRIPLFSDTSHDIILREFIDLDSDTVGVYALGHHELERFFEVVRYHQPEVPLSRDRFRHSWMKSTTHGFEEFATARPGTAPITVLDLYD